MGGLMAPRRKSIYSSSIVNIILSWYTTGAAAGQRHNDVTEEMETGGLKAEVEVAKTRKHTTIDNSTKRVLKVHLWDDTGPGGFREKKIYNPEGFSTHSETTLVDSPDDADLVVWVTVRGNTEEEVPPRYEPNVILLDYAGRCEFFLAS